MKDIREVIRANLFDGSEDGVVTISSGSTMASAAGRNPADGGSSPPHYTLDQLEEILTEDDEHSWPPDIGGEG